MPTPDLNVKNLNVSHGPVKDQNGQTVLGLKVSYMVGDHGPFYLDYADQTTPLSKVKADIQAQVDGLTDLRNWAG